MQRRQNIITWHVTAWHLTCRHWSVTRQRVSDSKLSFDGWHGDTGHYPSMGQWLKIIIWCVTQGRWALSRDTGSLGIIASTGQGQIINWCVTWGRWTLSRQWVRDKLSTDAWHRDAGHYRVNRSGTNYQLMRDTGTLGIIASTGQGQLSFDVWHRDTGY